MTKASLRQKYKALRSKLSLDDIDTLSLDIANRTLNLDIWNHSYYHIFLSITELKEINSEYILNILAGKDKHIVIPKTDFKQVSLKNYLLTDATKIKKNNYNIPEPIEGIEIAPDKIDVVFIPLLAFDKQGHRVGYGKGFYDNFLKTCRPNTLKIGLSFFEPETVIDDTFENDMPLDYCVTPYKTYVF